VRLADLNDFVTTKLNQAGDTGAAGPQGPKGEKGEQGVPGEKGESGLEGAYYAVAYYNGGDTNAGAIATVACKEVTDLAMSGGVQVLGLDATANSRNTPVSSSFPGRMNWDTNTPRENRLDGWIVQFGGNAGAESDKAPEKAKVWALCVPGTTVPVEQTFIQQAG
jgi:Collagen triple helix repeat (20 copies)